jgi:sec-independent protein translocase protein TatA
MSAVDPLVLFFGGSPSPGEILVILAIVLVMFGAKRLPEIARNLGKSMEAFRRAARDITDEIVHADTNADPVKKKQEASSDLPPPDTVASGNEESTPEDSDPAAAEEERDDGAA